MSIASYEIEQYHGLTNQQNSTLGSLQSQMAGCLQSGSVQPYMHYCYCLPPRELGDFEIVIEQTLVGTEPRLNYGAKLRSLMADPIHGHDLRDAISRLKIALKEAFYADHH
jgi:hypothetical protein